MPGPHALLVAGIIAQGALPRDALAYRPFDGTDADVAELGSFELELGPVHWYSQEDSHFVIAPATVLNLGFARGWEVVADFQNFLSIDRIPAQARDQLVDTDVLTKAILVPGVLQDRGAGPSVAVEFGPLLPTVNGEAGFGASCDLIVSVRWQTFTAHINSWFELTRGELHPDWFEGVILEGDTGHTFRPVSEWFVEHEFVSKATTFSGLVGGIWHAQDGLDFDAGLREASVGGQRAEEVRLGLTWSFSVWTPSRDLPHEGNP
jgi:hypothetical protein